MTNWYVAPDGTTVTGVTLVTIGTTGYASAWNKAAKWSDFIASGGVWNAKFQDGDTVIFLPGRYLSTSITGGWGTGLKSTTGSQIFPHINMTAQWPNGTNGFAHFVGSRTFPWPYDAQASPVPTYGETFMTINTDTHVASTFSWMHLQNWGIILSPGSATSQVLGTVDWGNCYFTNFDEGPNYADSDVKGQMSVTMNNCFARGYSSGVYRGWGSYTVRDVVCDSEFQATDRTANAQSTSAFNSFDAIAAASVSNHPCRVERGVFRGHAAGSQSGNNYPQGDALIGEENVADIQIIDVKTIGSGDRGIDLKCGGHVTRAVSYANGFGIGHHLDTTPVTVDQSYFGPTYRPLTLSPGVSSGGVQMSGWTIVKTSTIYQKQTAAAVAALAPATYNTYTVSVDPSKFQHSMYGCNHVGNLDIRDSILVYDTTDGAVKSNVANGSDTNCFLNIPVWGAVTGSGPYSVPGLTASSANIIKARGVDSGGNASAWSSTLTVNTAANLTAGVDVTKPATPAAPVVTGSTASSVSFTFTPISQDSGVATQGYLPYLKGPGDSVPILAAPGKSASPGKIDNLLSGSSYTLYLAAYDGNGNVSDLSTGAAFTTSGSLGGNTIGSAPTIPQIAVGMITTTNFTAKDQATMLALNATTGKTCYRQDTGQTFTLNTLPASTLGNWSSVTGVGIKHPRQLGVAIPKVTSQSYAVLNAIYYEIGDNSGNVIARAYPTATSFTVTASETNVKVATI